MTDIYTRALIFRFGIIHFHSLHLAVTHHTHGVNSVIISPPLDLSSYEIHVYHSKFVLMDFAISSFITILSHKLMNMIYYVHSCCEDSLSKSVWRLNSICRSITLSKNLSCVQASVSRSFLNCFMLLTFPLIPANHHTVDDIGLPNGLRNRFTLNDGDWWKILGKCRSSFIVPVLLEETWLESESSVPFHGMFSTLVLRLIPYSGLPNIL